MDAGRGLRQLGTGVRPRQSRILIVDDDEDTRGLLRDTLEAAGYVVLDAADGKAALDLLVTERGVQPSLIILDLQMPNLTGWDFLAIVRKYRQLARIPVIIISALEPSAPVGTAAGVAAWLRKPTDAKELLTLVAAHQSTAPQPLSGRSVSGGEGDDVA